MIRFIHSYFSGKFKLKSGFCPQCNSDAPEMDSCSICGGYHQYPPSFTTKQNWWDEYLKAISASLIIREQVKALKSLPE